MPTVHRKRRPSPQPGVRSAREGSRAPHRGFAASDRQRGPEPEHPAGEPTPPRSRSAGRTGEAQPGPRRSARRLGPRTTSVPVPSRGGAQRTRAPSPTTDRSTVRPPRRTAAAPPSQRRRRVPGLPGRSGRCLARPRGEPTQAPSRGRFAEPREADRACQGTAATARAVRRKGRRISDSTAVVLNTATPCSLAPADIAARSADLPTPASPRTTRAPP